MSAPGPALADHPAAPEATPLHLLHGLALLLLCQLAGESLVRLLHLPLPGPVLGLLVLMGALGWRRLQAPAGQAANALLQHLSLLFVPVGVGVVTHLSLLSQHGLRMALALLLSTWFGLAVTALVLQRLLPEAPAEPSGPEAGA